MLTTIEMPEASVCLENDSFGVISLGIVLCLVIGVLQVAFL